MKKLLIIMLLVLAYRSWGQDGSQQDRHSGLALLEHCKDSASSFDQGICHGVVWAVWNLEGENGNLCSPDGTTQKMVMLVVEKYLNDHPEELDKSDYLLVRKALRKAYPCKRAK